MVTTLYLMAPAFIFKNQSRRFIMHLCTRVKAFRKRCKYKLETKKQVKHVFGTRDNLNRTSVFSSSHNNRSSRQIIEIYEHHPNPMLSRYQLPRTVRYTLNSHSRSSRRRQTSIFSTFAQQVSATTVLCVSLFTTT